MSHRRSHSRSHGKLNTTPYGLKAHQEMAETTSKAPPTKSPMGETVLPPLKKYRFFAAHEAVDNFIAKFARLDKQDALNVWAAQKCAALEPGYLIAKWPMIAQHVALIENGVLATDLEKDMAMAAMQADGVLVMMNPNREDRPAPQTPLVTKHPTAAKSRHAEAPTVHGENTGLADMWDDVPEVQPAAAAAEAPAHVPQVVRPPWRERMGDGTSKDAPKQHDRHTK